MRNIMAPLVDSEGLGPGSVAKSRKRLESPSAGGLGRRIRRKSVVLVLVSSLPFLALFPFASVLSVYRLHFRHVYGFRRRDCRNRQQIARCVLRRRLKCCADRPSTDLRVG